MSSRIRRAATMLVICCVAVGCGQGAKAQRSIELTVLEDKVRGGWAGQMIGVAYGYPTEFKYLGTIIPEEELPEWAPEMVKGTLDQDDLYVDMTFAAVLDETQREIDICARYGDSVGYVFYLMRKTG